MRAAREHACCLFEQIDLALVEQPHLEPRQIGAETECGTSEHGCGVEAPRKRSELFEGLRCACLVADEQAGAAEAGERIGAEVGRVARVERAEGAREVAGGLLPRHRGEGALAGPYEPCGGVVPRGPGVEKVRGDDRGFGVGILQGRRGPSVERGNLRAAPTVERGEPKKIVGEGPRAGSRAPSDDTQCGHSVERVTDVTGCSVRERREIDGAKWAAENTGRGEQRAIRFTERVEALAKEITSACGDDAAGLGRRVVGEETGDLHDEERVARSEAQNLGTVLLRARVAEVTGKQCVDADVVEPAQPQLVGAAAESRERRAERYLGVAVGADDQHRQRGEMRGHHVEQLQRAFIGPMEVVEHQQRRSIGGRVVERAHHRGIGEGARRRGRGAVSGIGSDEHVDGRAARIAEPGQQRDPRCVRDGAPARPTRGPPHAHAFAPGDRCGLACCGRLADARLAEEQHESALT